MKAIHEFQKGAAAALPIILGYIPVGLAFGILALESGLDIRQTILFSLFIYTGAGQMAAASMIAMKISYLVIILTIGIMNLRHIIMSTVVMEKLRNVSVGKRLLLSFFVTDETFAVFTMEDEKRPSGWYFLGLGLCSWLSWNLGTWIGILSSRLLPEIISSSLGIALSAMFIALVVPQMKKSMRVVFLVFLSAFLSWSLSLFLSSSLSTILAILISSWLGTYFVKEEDVE